MSVIRVAQVPPPAVPITSTVFEAVKLMKAERCGATVVLDGDRLAGIFSERDVMLRVVAAGRDPRTTSVGEVMTSPPKTILTDTSKAAALELMVSQHIRHLPIVDQEGRITGLLSIRNLLQNHVDELVDQLNSLEAYISADGPGG